MCISVKGFRQHILLATFCIFSATSGSLFAQQLADNPVPFQPVGEIIANDNPSSDGGYPIAHEMNPLENRSAEEIAIFKGLTESDIKKIIDKHWEHPVFSLS